MKRLFSPDMYCSLPGPPLSEDSLITTLLSKGVNVAIGTVDAFAVRNTRFEVAWVCHDIYGKVPTLRVCRRHTIQMVE